MRAAAILVLLASCAPQSKHRDPETRLDRAVFFHEQDLQGGIHPLSGKTSVERLPAPGEVDINSTIHVKFLKEDLHPRRPGTPEPPELAPLADRRARIVAALGGLEEYLKARERAMQAYAAKAEDFAAVAREYGRVERAFLGALRELWPRDRQPEERAKLDEAWEKDRVTLRPFQAFLQAEIDLLDVQYKRVAETLKARGVSLRLEAFLDSPGAAPAALHLEGYDTLEARRVHVHDRFGLALNARERDVLEEARRASKEIADAAGRVLRREESMKEAFSRVTAGAARELTALIVEADALVAELGGKGKIQDRYRAAAADFKAFGDTLAAEVRTKLEEFQASLVETAGKMGPDADLTGLFNIVGQLKAVRDGLSAMGPETVTAVIDLARTVWIAAEGREALLRAAEELAQKAAAALEKAAGELKDVVLEKWAASEAKKRVEELDRDVRRVARLVRAAKGLLGFHAAPPAAPALRVPEAIDVGLAEAPNTWLDLTRTPRLTGDTVTVRASLVQEGQVTETSEASFVVREFGWHADLQPGVVLLRPVDLEGRDEDFEFAPTLSWLWRHHPRPEDTGVLAAINRFLEPSIGLHAAFPSYIPDKEVEIGLGITAALWGDRLVAGAGYNLMHDRDGEDVYGFVGTSLIPLLQSLGLGGGASAGEKP